VITRLAAAAARLAALTGWRRLAVAAGFGLAAVVALPPLHVLPVLPVVLPGLLWLLDGAGRKRTAFAVGWAFGLGFFVGGLYWIANALLIDPWRFGWMIPVAVGGLSAVLALYLGLVTLVVHLSRARGGWRVVVFAAAWTLAEILRGTLVTGFPWNPLATVWMPVEAMIQPAAWLGTYGLSGLTAGLFALPAVLAWPGRRRLALAIGAVLCGAAVMAGAARLPGGPAPAVPDVRLRLVQPAIPQSDKWKAESRRDNLRRYLALSLAAAEVPVTHVIWGETAIPYAMDGETDGDLPAILAEAVAATSADTAAPALISGVVRRTPPGVAPYRVWNSMVVLGRDGAEHGRFDKFHLVPFGEYVPFRDILPLDKITPGGTDFTAGPGPRTVDLPGLPPASPLICYEVIFPGAVTAEARRPAWLLNLTNDGWYGLSSGPYQHLATARLRAVEEGLPLVRVANTGVSAIVDPWGRVVASLGLETAGVVDGPLPRPLPATLFATTGSGPAAYGSLVLIMIAAIFGWRRRRAAAGLGA
jgi:apolipoprotein N-acyltransferase